MYRGMKKHTHPHTHISPHIRFSCACAGCSVATQPNEGEAGHENTFKKTESGGYLTVVLLARVRKHFAPGDARIMLFKHAHRL